MNKCILFFGCVYCSFFQCMGAGPTVKDSEYAYTGINETKYTNLLSSLRNKNKITTNDCKWLCDFVLKKQQ